MNLPFPKPEEKKTLPSTTNVASELLHKQHMFLKSLNTVPSHLRVVLVAAQPDNAKGQVYVETT